MRANEAARSETGGGVGTGTEMLEDHEDPEDDKMEPLLALEEKEDKNEKPNDEAKVPLDEELIKDFEDVLGYVGGWGRYQITLLVISMPFTVFLSYVAYSPILFLYVPDHWCAPNPDWKIFKAHENRDNVIDWIIPKDPVTGERSQCLMYNYPEEAKVLSEFEEAVFGSGANRSHYPDTVPCRYGWNYNFTGFFHSVATDMNWVCEDAWKPAFTQSVFFCGGIVGTLFFGYAADHMGRLWTLMVSNAVMMISGIATPFCTNFSTFTAIRFLLGCSHTTFFTVFIMLELEYVSISKRSLVGNLSLAISLTIGCSYQPWLLMYLGDWKIWHHILYAQTIVVVAAPWLVQESVRWLAGKGEKEKCIKILKDIARKNGKIVKPEVYESFRRLVGRQKEVQKSVSWLDLFKTPRLRRNTLLMIATWMCIASMFDGHIRNIGNLDYSIYWTFTISALLEFPSDVLAIFGLNVIGRRWSAFLSQALAGICMIITGLCLEFDMLSTVWAMIGRFFITYAMNTGGQITYEIAPTQLRGQANALANVCGQGAMFFSPFIVYSEVYDHRLPFLILGLGSFLGAAFSLFLPETAGVDLPDTVEDAEQFGKGQKFWLVPCIEKRKSKKISRDNTASTMLQSF